MYSSCLRPMGCMRRRNLCRGVACPRADQIAWRRCSGEKDCWAGRRWHVKWKELQQVASCAHKRLQRRSICEKVRCLQRIAWACAARNPQTTELPPKKQELSTLHILAKRQRCLLWRILGTVSLNSETCLVPSLFQLNMPEVFYFQMVRWFSPAQKLQMQR